MPLYIIFAARQEDLENKRLDSGGEGKEGVVERSGEPDLTGRKIFDKAAGPFTVVSPALLRGGFDFWGSCVVKEGKFAFSLIF